MKKEDDVETFTSIVKDEENISNERILNILRQIKIGGRINIHTAKAIVLSYRPHLKDSVKR